MQFLVFRLFRKKRLLPSSSPFVCQSAPHVDPISAAPTGLISVKFYIQDFHETPSRQSKFSYNRAKISGTLHVYIHTYVLLFSATLNRHKSALKGYEFVRPSICPPVGLSACISAAPTERIYVQFDIRDFYEYLSSSFKFR